MVMIPGRLRPRLPSLLSSVALALFSATLAVVGLGISAPATAAPPADGPHRAAARLAGEWIAGQLVDGGMPGFVGTDWG